MTDMNGFHYTDDVHDVLAIYVNRLMDSTLRSEYKNIETLTADRELTDADTPIQRFDCGDADRVVTAPVEDAVENHPFLLVNASAVARTLTFKNNAGSTALAALTQGQKCLALPDGDGGYGVVFIGAGGLSLSDVYPIGSVYISVSATNPATLFGFGTWAAFGAGRTLVGLDAGQTEFNTVEETGGAKTHTLTTAETPSHAHTMWSQSKYSTPAAGSSSMAAIDGAGTTGAHVTGGAGSDGAHNNLQPYIVVYMWKRTA